MALKSKFLDKNEPLSKAINFLLKEGTAVVVLDGDKIKGIVDDRHIKGTAKPIDKVKLGSVCVKCPKIYEGASLKDHIKSFLDGHFKALPYIKNGKLVGLISRVEILQEILDKGLLPDKVCKEVMVSPVYTIEYNKTIGDAKRLMKSKKVHKLIVIKNKKIFGIISSFDLMGLLLLKKGKQRMQLITTKENLDKKRIADFVRDRVRVKPLDSLNKAVKLMIDSKISSLIVADKEIPKGIISAVDIFKLVLKEMRKRESVVISGLDEDTKMYYLEIENRVNKFLNKIKQTFKFPKPKLHVKKTKSLFHLNFQIKLEKKLYTIKTKEYKMSLALKKLEKEVMQIVAKLKTKKKVRRK